MPKTRFLASVGGFWPVLGPRPYSRPQNPPKSPKFENAKKFGTRVLTQFFCRLPKDPKRLGLGQKSSGKTSVGAKRAAIYGAKNTGHLKYQNGPKMAILEKNFFRILAIKWAKQGVFFIVGYIQYPRNITKTLAKVKN